MPTIAEALQLAVQHHQARQLAEAEHIYRQILQASPNHPEALHLLGLIAHQVGKSEIAIEYMERSIQLDPTKAEFYINLAEVYRALQRTDAAIAAWKKVFELNPQYLVSRIEQGSACLAQQQIEVALQCFEQVWNIPLDLPFTIQYRPLILKTSLQWALALHAQDRIAPAMRCLQQVITLEPGFAEGYNLLGVMLQQNGDAEAGTNYFQQAIQRKPELAEAHYNLGLAFTKQNRTEDAAFAIQRAIELNPNFEAAFNTLGTIEHAQKNYANAEKAYRRCLELNSKNADAHYNLGALLVDLGDREAAIREYAESLSLNPNNIAAKGNLIHQFQQLCCWDQLDSLSKDLISVVNEAAQQGRAVPLSSFNFITLPIATTAAQQFTCARLTLQKGIITASNTVGKINVPLVTQPHEKIRLGFLSADFHAHATAWLIAELIEKIDPQRFTLYAYSYGHDDQSSMRRRLTHAFDHFVDVQQWQNITAAQRIANDEIDILIDLKGYTKDCRGEILSYRPAPIQVNFLGYPGTMGVDEFDYILVDDFVVPPDQQPYFSERLVHLPGCYQPNDRQREIAAETPTRAACGLPATGFIFCSFNNNYKITAEMFEVWMSLLRDVPHSVLWLLAGNAIAPGNLRQEAARRGVAPERLVFAERCELPQHLARHRLADLFLDTFPVNAHTTASDALWAGCPLLTLAGETFISRVAGSLLRTLELPELITSSLAEYRSRALHLAHHPQELHALRERLAANRETTSLFNSDHFARKIEAAFLKMIELQRSGAHPQAFRITEAMLPHRD
jgi:protein O-GlcNAc transferase